MKNLVFKFGILAVIMGFISCSDDDNTDNQDPNSETYNTSVAITDAPIDNANVTAAVVTITDVKIDGVSLEGFSKTTIDLMTLQNGTISTLGNIDLKAGTVSNVSLVLDYEADAQGNFPGAYIETVDGVKHQLEASVNEISINDEVEIIASATNEIIIDFDLRKTITESGETTDQYDFVTNAELSAGLRLVNSVKAGTVTGTVSDVEETTDLVIVYAYETGTYTAAEAETQGESNIQFANAVTSSIVSSADSSYELNFLSEGNYEVHYASYTDEDEDGEFEFNGMLSVESLTDIALNNIHVTSSMNLSLNVIVTGSL